ncbi:MAG: DnaJ domain-containing protein [Rhizobiaceae bacterium]|nr:DnaJ domain-containing protein [Rhizobiaceae bacterium]
MAYFSGFIAIVLILSLLGFGLIITSPAAIARGIRMAVPLTLLLVGGILSLAGKISLGLPMIAIGVSFWLRGRRAQQMHSSSGRTSTVRTVWLEMQLEHDTGAMDGIILAGNSEGVQLSQMDEGRLLTLYEELSGDGESCALLEAYLDSRLPDWREHTDTGSGGGHGNAFGSGAMAKEEAYQILGLSPGAGSKDIRDAHRRLMKRIHPDSGGSTFLAAKINEAKDILTG